MKMSAALFARLKDAVESQASKGIGGKAKAEQYKANGLRHSRFRWDLLATAVATHPNLCWADFYNEPSKGGEDLTDNHIDTALRSVLGGDYA